MNNRVFFTSIPKCGKNIIYSLFGGLGYSRHAFETERFARDAYFDKFELDNYLYPRAQLGAFDFSGFATELGRMRPRSVFHRHLLPRSEFFAALSNAGIRPILVVRDPRDAALSAAHWAIAGKPEHVVAILPSRDPKEIVRFLLRGDHDTVKFADHFDAYRDWCSNPETLVVRFEDIIGASGGGSAERQRWIVERILNHVGISDTQAVIASAIDSVFNRRAGTFFKGQIGSWREFADAELNQLFEAMAGHLLETWGYE